MSIITSRLSGWVVGGIAAALFFFLWQLSDAKVDSLKDKNKLLTDAIATQKLSMELSSTIIKDNMERLSRYELRVSEAVKENSNLEREINDRRKTEEAAANMAPFERADAFNARLGNIMRAPKHKDIVDTDTGPATDTPRAEDGRNK